MARSLMYVERCIGADHDGEAYIGYVEQSKTGRTIYFNDVGLSRVTRGGVMGNYVNVENGEEYWVSGVKKRGTNRHWAGSGKVAIERPAVAEYLELTGQTEVDSSLFEVVEPFAQTDRERIHKVLHDPLYDEEA